MESKCLAVTGNTGKTIFSFYLAQLLSSTKKRVVMVSTDGCYPVYRMLFPHKKGRESNAKSLGKLLSLPAIAQSDIFSHAQLVNDNFFMLSYDERESSLNYPAIAEANLNALFSELSEIADVILVDTATAGNKIDQFVLNGHASRLVITSADQKGFYYRELHPEGRWNLYLQACKHNSLQDIETSFHDPKAALLLPYSGNLQAVYNGIDITDISPNAPYRKILIRIAGELL